MRIRLRELRSLIREAVDDARSRVYGSMHEAVAGLDGRQVAGLDDFSRGYELTAVDAADIYDSIVDYVNIMIERSTGTPTGPTWESIGRKLTNHGEFDTVEQMEKWFDNQGRIVRSARPGLVGNNAWKIWQHVINELRKLIRESKLHYARLRKEMRESINSDDTMSAELNAFKQALDMKLAAAKKSGPGTSAFDRAHNAMLRAFDALDVTDKKKAKALLRKSTKKPIRTPQGHNY